MKKIFVAVVMTALSSVAFAGNNNNTSINASATSSVGSSTYSASSVNSARGNSSHFAYSTAHNTTVAGGANVDLLGNSGLVGEFGPSAGATSGALTVGSTKTVAGGSGAGTAQAYAGQAGYGSATVNQNLFTNFSFEQPCAGTNTSVNVKGNVKVSSQAGTGTWSEATVTNNGHAENGSTGFAANVASASIAGAGIGGTLPFGETPITGGIVASNAATHNISYSNASNWVDSNETVGNAVVTAGALTGVPGAAASGQTSGTVTTTLKVNSVNHPRP